MGTDGACSLLFCAAKRSGAFPPNVSDGLKSSCVASRRFQEAVLRVFGSAF
jgi:hypothetical protein